MSRTSISGLLGRGSMFVFFIDPFQRLLKINPDWKTHRLLALGAGDGEVTKFMSPHFEEIYAWAVWNYDMAAIEEEIQSAWYKWMAEDEGFSMMSPAFCWTVCDHSLTLLKRYQKCLGANPEGRVILSLVLPFSSLCGSDVGGKWDKPLEILKSRNRIGKNKWIVCQMFSEKAGLLLKAFTRAAIPVWGRHV